ncbi:hypothetical protein O181_086147 [Austropuccinia psidii MF-1]|uniref:Uncharacterized protein n=1 Tax=Austropuccinia psidii MF-1 TaxID=1389203 RepID=A0A9Q3IM81_9BASI|nr:hypothetical protein [Austropuccinia psidii MF-1]
MPTEAIDNTWVNFGTMGENVPNIINQTPQQQKVFPFGRRYSMSLSSAQKDHNFANNMNQNMLSPLLVLIQHGQEQAEERDRIQQDQEIELRSQEAEREERRRTTSRRS